MDKDSRIKELEEENEKLKEHLKRYTAPSYKKAYYEKNKEKLLAKIKSNQVPPEKRKEYNKKSYLKRKEKIKENQNDEDI
jgi:hypothetical protein